MRICWPLEAEAALDEALQLAEGDGAAAEGDGADDAAGDRQRVHRVAVSFTAIQLHRRDRRGRPAPHAVVERDHLRHVGHGDAFAAPPGEGRADEHRRNDQLVVAHPGVEEGDERRHQHAGARPQDAAARAHRGAHALEPDDEEHGGEEVTRLDQQLPRQPRRHQWFPLPALRVPLDLNISSMRSVTT